ncbi:radical SAM protein [Clostridiales bacterium F-3ap]|uniref:Radical SAM protein n=1 Tax=Anaerotalea alkaliphila TaxID=2662126 RepID=A0A7X5HTM2_9FIRM|nr:radical SAM protein [Anaerotalea alkaliphila]
MEITNICNLDCAFCPQTGRQEAFMDLASFSQVAEQVKPFTDRILLHVMGEPLLHPDLEGILEVCREKGLEVEITTNGTLLGTAGMLLPGHPAVTRVNVSLHSMEENGDTDHYHSYIRPVAAFLEKAFMEGSPSVCLRFWNGTGERRETKVLMPGVLLQYDTPFVWPVDAEGSSTAPIRCFGLRDHLGILVDGSVVPCCLDSEGILALGNLKEQPLAGILDAVHTRKAYRDICNRKPIGELCTHCNFHRRRGSQG